MISADPDAPTILLIDGHDHDRTYYRDRLKNALVNCVILEATDGKSGLDLYKSEAVDCVVSELQLPDMSVLEFLLDIVPPQAHQQVAVVILTRAALPASADLMRRHGAQAVLVKRLTSGDELAEAIQKAIAVVRKGRPGE
jgi:two-component system, chemotaxis family, chemotaxis protein CheY